MTPAPFKLVCTNRLEVINLRHSLELNQQQFWQPLLVSQSRGSRYEAGRHIPAQVLMLIHLAYAEKASADHLYDLIRNDKLGSLAKDIPARTRRKQTPAAAAQH